MNRKQTAQLFLLAANCGIDARGLSVADVFFAHERNRHPNFSDQHDARLDELLAELGVQRLRVRP